MSASDATPWAHGRLGDLLPIKYGKSLPDRLRDPNGTVPVFGSSGRVGVHTEALTRGPALIVGRKGSVGSVYFSEVPCWPIDTVYFTEAAAGQNLRYFKYLLDSLRLVQLDKSTAVPGLSRDDYNAVTVAIALPQQQVEIVAEIEKQFSRLDEAVANLQRVKANLKRYRAAVLKAAVEGRLVPVEAELARNEQRNYESGPALLQRILRTCSNDASRKRREPASFEANGHLGLPEGWAWCSIAQIGIVASGNTPAGILEAATPTGTTPWFKVGDMNHDENKTVLRRADAWLSQHEVKRLSMRVFPSQSVLFPKRGGAIATNKKRRLESPGCADLNVMGITPSTEVSDYFFMWFDSVDLASLSDGSNVPQINHKDIDPLAVPLPPLAEQHRIVAEVDRRLSIVREVEAEVDANLKRAQALRQAVLAKAFDAGTPRQTT